jgi:hypothetical protein
VCDCRHSRSYVGIVCATAGTAGLFVGIVCATAGTAGLM